MTDDVAKAKQIADQIRAIDPGKAKQIDKLIEDYQSGRRENCNVSVQAHYKLEKFEGKYEPGKRPVETIEGDML